MRQIRGIFLFQKLLYGSSNVSSSVHNGPRDHLFRRSDKKNVEKIFLRQVTTKEIQQVLESLQKNQPRLPLYQEKLHISNRRTIGAYSDYFDSKTI